MNRTYHFLAFDLGATSGRAILGTLDGKQLFLRDVHRFLNRLVERDGKFYWDFAALCEHLYTSLRILSAEGLAQKLDAVGVDTWGVDVVYIGADGQVVGMPRSYRDPYTNGAPEAFFERISRAQVYALTGIQILNFNTLYQLFAARREGSPELDKAQSILFMPDALNYMLTGRRVCEYTIASTSQFLNPVTRQLEASLLEAAGINPALLPALVMPGTKIGPVAGSIAAACGMEDVPVVAVGGHDTASAVAAVPAEDEQFAYLSSGTWSLMGVELPSPMITDESFAANFTNEGGVEGTTRFLKNITGMWLLEQCRREWTAAGREYDYAQITAMTRAAEPFRSLVDPDSPDFANPASMTEALVAFCRRTGQPEPQTDAQLMRTIFDSLALKYRHVLRMLQQIAPFAIKRLHVIGGGSQNGLLNQMTADAIGMPVVAGPAEATAIGNILMQARGLGVVDSLAQMRRIVRASTDLETFDPASTPAWDAVAERFETLIGK